MIMENNVGKATSASDAGATETEDLHDFRRDCMVAVKSEWAKINTNMLDKKKQKTEAKQPRNLLLRVVGNLKLLTCCMIVCYKTK